MLGIPTIEQINAAVAGAIQEATTSAGGFEKATAADLQGAIASAVAGILQVEAQADRDLAALTAPFLEEIRGLRAEITQFRELIARGLRLDWGSK